jgi:nucleotide-binding universal stress UspA family protein
MSGFSYKKIVVPVDFSDFSLKAIDRAIELADEQTEIHAIHVMLPLNVMEPGVMFGEVTDESRRKNVEKHLRQQIKDDGKVTTHAVVGDPGQEIVSFAKNEAADLIVIPSHGYGFFKHLLLGSVAERVVRLAHCPVLVLKPE